MFTERGTLPSSQPTDYALTDLRCAAIRLFRLLAPHAYPPHEAREDHVQRQRAEQREGLRDERASDSIMPGGRRSSEHSPRSIAIGGPARMAAMKVIMMVGHVT